MATYTVWPVTTAATAANEVLAKEDVSNYISNLFPLDTPLHQALDRMDMPNVFTEQPIDTFTGINRTQSVLAVAGGSGTPYTSFLAKPEGSTEADIGTTTPSYPGRLISVAEIQQRYISVSETNRATSHYAIADRFAYEALKETATVVNNSEHSFWWSFGTPPGGVDADSGGGVVNIRQTQGLVHWIAKSGLQRSIIGLGADSFVDGHGNQFGDGGGSVPLPIQQASSYMFNAAGTPLNQTMFKNSLMEQWWQITGRTGGAMGFAGGRIKALISGFALSENGPINERTIDAAKQLVVDEIDYYKTDYGIVSINLCRYLSLPNESVSISQSSGSVTVPFNNVLLFIQPAYFKIGVHRPVSFSMLGKDGDRDRGFVRGEQALVCVNPSGGAGIVNCA